jgi:hypothetical protein
MKRLEPQFAYLGGRDYVHGPSIFGYFHEQIRTATGRAVAIDVSHFRVNQLIRQNYAAYIFEPNDPSKPVGAQPLAEMSCAIEGQRWTAILADEPLGPIGKQEPSNEKDYVGPVEHVGPFSGKAKLVRLRDNETLIQGVVEANKQLHLASVAAAHPGHVPKFRFVYCLNYRCPIELPATTGSITIESAGVNQTATHVFTLTKAELELGGWRSKFRICFATEDRQAMDFAIMDKIA